MVIGPDKEKIRRILAKSITEPNLNEKKNFKIEYKYTDFIDDSIEEIDEKNKPNEKFKTSEAKNDEEDFNFSNDSFNFSNESNQHIDNPLYDVKNIKKLTYFAIGVLSVKFPISDKTFFYTGFSIDTNVIVTLASNLEDKNKGEKLNQL